MKKLLIGLVLFATASPTFAGYYGDLVAWGSCQVIGTSRTNPYYDKGVTDLYVYTVPRYWEGGPAMIGEYYHWSPDPTPINTLRAPLAMLKAHSRAYGYEPATVVIKYKSSNNTYNTLIIGPSRAELLIGGTSKRVPMDCFVIR